MKISCTTLCCPEWTLETVLARFAEFGYDAVDFRGLGTESDLWKVEPFASSPQRAADRIAAAGLKVSALSSSVRMYCPDAAERAKGLDELRQYARLCRILGAPMIRVFGGAMKGAAVPAAIGASVEALHEMADAVGDDIALAVETHDDWVATGPLAEVIGRVGRPNVGVLWDLHHPFRMAGESPRRTFDNIGRQTIAVHLKDSRPTGGGKYEYCLPGEGDVPLAEMVALLAGGGYDGYLTLEWEKRWHPEIAGPEVALPAYARFMKRLS